MELITDFFLIAGITIGGIVIGYILRDFMLLRETIRLLQNAVDLDQRKSKKQKPDSETRIYDGMNLVHNIENDRHYFYDESKNFVCHGISLQEAAQNYSHLQGKNYVGMFIHHDSNKQYFFLAGEVHESDGKAT